MRSTFLLVLELLSAIQVISQIPLSCSFQYDYNVDYEGGNAWSHGIFYDRDLCMEWCGRRDDCVFFTYDPQTKICHYKNGGYNWTPKSGVTSGRGCFHEGCGYINKGTDYVFGDITDPQPVDNYLDCQKACGQLNGCKYFTFDTETKLCYFKAEGFKEVHKKTTISGNGCV